MQHSQWEGEVSEVEGGAQEVRLQQASAAISTDYAPCWAPAATMVGTACSIRPCQHFMTCLEIWIGAMAKEKGVYNITVAPLLSRFAARP